MGILSFMCERIGCVMCGKMYERCLLDKASRCMACQRKSEIEDYVDGLALMVECTMVMKWLRDYDRRRKAGIA